MQVEAEAEQGSAQLPDSELPGRGAHGTAEAEQGGAQAEQEIPERGCAAAADRTQQIVEQTESDPADAGQEQGEPLRGQTSLHSAEQPRPERARG